MTQYEIYVEESLKLADKGILALISKNGRILYVKAVNKDKKGNIYLSILTKEQLKELKISVEETLCDNRSEKEFFEKDVEESESEEEKIERVSQKLKEELDKKTHTVDMSNLNEVETAKKVLAEREKALAEAEGKKTREELESEVEDYKAKLEIVAEKELEKRMNALGLTESQKNRIRTSEHPVEALKGVVVGLSKKGEGYAPLSGQDVKYSGNVDNLFGKTYDSFKAMIDDLHKMARSSDKEISKKADAILTELMKRTRIEEFKQKGFSSESEKLEMPSIEKLQTRKKKSENQVGLEDT